MSEWDPRSKLEVHHYLVALVDILGQKHALQGWSKLPETKVQEDAFWASVKATAGNVGLVRHHCQTLVAEFKKQGVPEYVVAQLPVDELEWYRNYRRSDLNIQMFSDTLVWFSPLEEPSQLAALRDVFGTLAGLAMSIPLLLGKFRIVIRGGLDIGLGTGWFPGEIYGPVLASAYDLEQKAKSPRVLIGPNLVEWLSDSSLLDGNGRISEFVRAMTSMMQTKLLTTDSDGAVVLDFLGEYVRSNAEQISSVDIVCCVADAYRFVVQQHEQILKSGDTHVVEKYSQLRAYFDSRAELWDLPSL